MSPRLFVPVFFFAILASSCTPAQPPKPAYEIEVVTVEDLINEEIAEASTDFVLPFSEDEIAWTRAKIFFERYLAQNQPAAFSEHRNKVTNRGAADQRFVYAVTREPAKEGMRYTVKCDPAQATDISYAERNAKNLARFIAEGTLELTLLVK